MKKLITIIIFCITICTIPANSQIITGGIETTVEQAWDEISLSEEKFNPYNIIHNFKDPNYRENQAMLLKGVTELKDRKLGKFSDGSYAVIYYNDKKNTYYYSPEGILTHNEIRSGVEYPYKASKYSIDGKLVNKSLKQSEYETFIFTSSGKLLAHWIGENCYDENKNIIMTRKIYK